jgi:hypothetical protein
MLTRTVAYFAREARQADIDMSLHRGYPKLRSQDLNADSASSYRAITVVSFNTSATEEPDRVTGSSHSGT